MENPSCPLAYSPNIINQCAFSSSASVSTNQDMTRQEITEVLGRLCITSIIVTDTLVILSCSNVTFYVSQLSVDYFLCA